MATSRTRGKGARGGGATTSRAVASKAARVLAGDEATADEKSVAASALAQAGEGLVGRPEDATVEDVAALGRRYHAELGEERDRNSELGRQLRDQASMIETLEAANVSLQTEVQRLTAQLAEQQPADVAALQAEVTHLREQLQWHKDQASTRRS